MTEHTATDDVPRFHTVGVGAGPANLSLAALYASVTSESMVLFDKQPGPAWHPTLLYPGVRMQTGWLKDLVSLVDPKHDLTFLNYLVTTGRLYALLNSQFDVIPRIEYQRYLAWAAEQLPNVRYGVAVERVSFTDDGFVVWAHGRPQARAEHLVVGVGTAPYVPEVLSGLPPERAFLADDLPWRLADTGPDEKAAPVAVVGGGQTGIEAVFRLLGDGFTDIWWFGRHQWFQSIDDSPIANDFYRPSHLAYLQQLPRATRRQMIAEHRLTGDALTPGALKALYQANYDAMLELGRFPVTLLPGREVTAGEMDGTDVVLRCASAQRPEQHRFRPVVIAAGREHVPAPFDEELRERIDVDDDDEMVVEADFSVRWKGMNGHRIFALNHSRYSHGLTNAGVTLLPVRAAMVLNSLFGRECFKISDELCPVRW